MATSVDDALEASPFGLLVFDTRLNILLALSLPFSSVFNYIQVCKRFLRDYDSDEHWMRRYWAMAALAQWYRHILHIYNP